MTCNAGFGLAPSGHTAFVRPSAPKTRTFACDAFCNSTRSWCKPVLCGHYTVPNETQAVYQPGGSTAQAVAANTYGHCLSSYASTCSVTRACSMHAVSHNCNSQTLTGKSLT